MPQVEIDEADLLRLRRLDKTVGTILSNPAARKKLAAATKEILPEDPLSKEADAVDPVEQRFDALTKRNDELAKQIADDKSSRERDAKLDELKRTQDRGFDALRADKWTEDGIQKVRAVMEEKGILDVQIAAKWVESQMPPQNPITPGGSGAWGFMDPPREGDLDSFVKGLKESKGENDLLVNRRAQDAIAEMRGSSRR